MIAQVIAAAALLLCAACGGAPPATGAGTGLKPCPSTPNCVSSRESDPARRVDPLPLYGSAAEGLAAVRQVILAMPRSRIAAEGTGFLRAEFRSLIFRFVDDVDFVVDEPAGVIHIRSAARVGRSDMGVNRRRVGEIRDRLSALHPPAAGAKRQ
jgi:uncharacterized protein (DUF1499 family)